MDLDLRILSEIFKNYDIKMNQIEISILRTTETSCKNYYCIILMAWLIFFKNIIRNTYHINFIKSKIKANLFYWSRNMLHICNILSLRTEISRINNKFISVSRRETNTDMERVCQVSTPNATIYWSEMLSWW